MTHTTRAHGRRILSILMAFVLALSLLPTAAFAATVDNTYTPGTYTGEATGYGGTVSVEVTLTEEDGAVTISNINATGEKETSSKWTQAQTILGTIKTQNGTEGLEAKLTNKEIDAVTGATVSAKAIVAATEQALAKAAPSMTGSGTEKNPYVISSAAQLSAFATAVDGGETYEGKYIVLGNDVDLSGIANWNPIGQEGKGSAAIFRGSFDGDGYSITRLKIDKTHTEGEANYGLFSTIGNNAVVKNLNVVDASVSVSCSGDLVRAGIIAGATEKVGSAGHANIGTRIDSCSTTGSVSAVSTSDKMTYAGGIAGMGNMGTAITNCWTDASVSAVAQAVSNKNSMAGGIIGSSGNYVVIANCATFGGVSAASPSATNFGGMAGGIVGIMAGKQYNAYAIGDITIGNGGTSHTWVGALDGEVTSSGMDKSNNYTTYPSEGAFRLHNYYATDVVLKEEVYKNNGAELDTTTVINPTVDRGTSTTINTVDKAMVSTAMTKKTMAAADFTETLNANIREINGILTAYGITGIELREWKLEKGKVLPTGEVWTSGEIDASIFASGTGSNNSPYIIKTEAQLRSFAASLTSKINYTNTYIALGNDITLSRTQWSPIGGSDYLFNGNFDGAGHTISSMTMGTADGPYEMNKDNIYVGMFGILGPNAVVKDVKLTDVSFYSTYAATGYVGGIAGAMQGSTTSGNFTGAVIDGCSVSGTISHTSSKGNQMVGGLVGMQYKGAILNSSAQVNLSGVVTSGYLAEVGGLVGLNNRGLVANCWSDSTVYGSGSRENGNEGMAVVSNLVACNAGSLVNCYGSGNVTTKEHSVYAGMVSGWVTGIGKSYNCWYDLDSTMKLKAGDSKPQIVNPVESIGTKVASGVNDEGNAYTGGLVDKMTGVKGASKDVADALNASFSAFPIDVTVYGVANTGLKKWTFDTALGFGESATITYVQPECEKYVAPALAMKDGVWYGRDDAKTTVVKITVADGAITDTEVLSGSNSGEAYDAALEKAKYKANYGDFSHYEAADPSRFAGGSGTAADPYLIANEAQLRYLSSSINADVDWSGVYFKQTTDIALTGGNWTPIGWSINGEVKGAQKTICAYPFRGNYDGGDHTISGLTIGSKNAPADQTTSGLFGLVSGAYTGNNKPDGSEQVVELKNIKLRNVNINVSTRYQTYTGGLVGSGQNGIYIDNCSVTGTINVTTSESFARGGGLAASVLRGAVTNSWADVDITAVTDTNHVYAGGLYGMDNRVTTVNCYALGDITGNSTNNNKVHIGGLVGQGGGIHVNCYAAGNVISLKSTTDVGILNGRSAGINVEVNCYYNTKATLKQGDTTVSPAVANGVAVENATEKNIVGKTAAELASADFAALLNNNIAETAMGKALATVNNAIASPGSGLTQQNYYRDNKLLGWNLKNGVVTFKSESSAGSSGGSGSHSSGGSSSSGTYTVTAPSNTANGTVTVSPKNASKGSSVTITVKPDSGYALDQLKVKDRSGKQITLTDKGNGQFTFTMPASKVTVEASFAKTEQPGTTGFTDVSASAYYEDAVAWAVSQGITTGTSATTFSPDASCTRGQIVTFLWRAAGSPSPKGTSSFADVPAESYYAQAVAWAVENGITNGTGEGTFSPDTPCDRSQSVTFLFRALGGKTAGDAAFSDVPAGSYYASAVAWAAEQGITTGTSSTTFSPNDTCTRGQIVTFLYRGYQGK